MRTKDKCAMWSDKKVTLKSGMTNTSAGQERAWINSKLAGKSSASKKNKTPIRKTTIAGG